MRFVQSHESFRKPELDALAVLEGIDLEWVVYGQYVRSDPWDSFASRAHLIPQDFIEAFMSLDSFCLSNAQILLIVLLLIFQSLHLSILKIVWLFLPWLLHRSNA